MWSCQVIVKSASMFSDCMNFHDMDIQALTENFFNSIFVEILFPGKHSSLPKGRNMTDLPQLGQDFNTEERTGETTADKSGLLTVLTKVKPQLEHIITKHRY